MVRQENGVKANASFFEQISEILVVSVEMGKDGSRVSLG